MSIPSDPRPRSTAWNMIAGGLRCRPPHAPVHGRVLGVRRGQQHKEGGHRLDVTVGGDESTEVIIRVPQGACANWDGKKVVLYLED